MSTTKDKIRAAQDQEIRTVEVPEWGVTVRVRSMSARDRAAVFAETSANNDVVQLDSFWGRILTECILEPDTDEPVFTAEDVEWLLAEKSADVIANLAEVCLEVSGLTPDAADIVGKDSSGSTEETPNGASIST